MEQMNEVLASSIYNVGNISRDNFEGWKKIAIYCESITEPTILDFRGISLDSPWLNDNFKRLMKNENIHLRVYSSHTTADNIDVMCSLGNLKSGRVINVDIEAEYVEPKSNATIMRKKDKIIDAFKIDDSDIAELIMQDVVNQLGDASTVEALKLAIQQLHEQYGLKKYIIRFERMTIQNNTAQILSDMCSEFLKNDIEVAPVSLDHETTTRLAMHQSFSNKKNLSEEIREELVTQLIAKNTVGLLMAYRNSRKRDDFGRKGDGIVIWCRVAIFKGIVTRPNGGRLFAFTVFNGANFMTKDHFYVTNSIGYDSDGVANDILAEPNLAYTELLLSIDELGIFNKLLGSSYHFMLPIQRELSENIEVYTKQNGRMALTSITLPESISLVLKDWGIDHDEASLIYCINETKNNLERLAKAKAEEQNDEI